VWVPAWSLTVFSIFVVFSVSVMFYFCFHCLLFTFGKCRSLSRFPSGTAVVLVVVFFTVAGRVTYPVFAMLHLHVGTGVKSVLQLTVPLLLHYVCGWVIGFHLLLLSWGRGFFSVPSGLLLGVVFSRWPRISCWAELCRRRLRGCLNTKNCH
jgi:hypothetical protein